MGLEWRLGQCSSREFCSSELDPQGTGLACGSGECLLNFSLCAIWLVGLEWRFGSVVPANLAHLSWIAGNWFSVRQRMFTEFFVGFWGFMSELYSSNCLISLVIISVVCVYLSG